jgi:hypothetical protein
MAMHDRYARAWSEYLVIDQATFGASRDHDDDRRDKLYRALKASTRETDALRLTILHQVPTTWVEAMVLQFHITTMFDMLNSVDEPAAAVERETLATAIDTLFDFMCCEVDQDHGELGQTFFDDAGRVHLARRYRTGLLED